MFNHPTLKLNGITFAELLTPSGCERLDKDFLTWFAKVNPALHQPFSAYRHHALNPSKVEESELLIQSAPYLEKFIAELFGIDNEVRRLKNQTLSHSPIFAFKAHYVQKHAKRNVSKINEIDSYSALHSWLWEQVAPSADPELSLAEYGVLLLEDPEVFQDNIQRLIDWCTHSLVTPEAQQFVKHWVSFKLPNKLDYQALVSEVPADDLRQRDGFSLTDSRMSPREVMSEIDYCVYCHQNEGDFCSSGFPVKKNQPELGLKKNPLDETMTGCPLEEKISEMHSLKLEGYGISALAVVMIDNPLCAVTGHRICNDCMKGCIYQKQDPVNIPQVETGVLTDVLALPWGVEIYDLLIRWNPLRRDQPFIKPYNGRKVMVMGMGPAGFTLAHYLSMAGCLVVGVDGLKIEPLPTSLLTEPIYSFEDIKEDLADRLMAGFGGVAEYGITVRWDKNFLKLIYLSLMRRQHFSVYGGVRFGGTITVEDVFALGFDHLAVAVGAGLPKELSIPGSMAPGMRQANDFLMALQLTGAAKKTSLANLQVRLPAVVIGGGLTGIDTATEIQVFYIQQVEKVLSRVETLLKEGLDLELHFPTIENDILQEFLAHGRIVREERKLAQKENRSPNFLGLIHSWGGVTIAYRRTLQESPAYKRNHEEVQKAMEEGIFYAENLDPVSVRLDHHGHVEALVCRDFAQTEKILPAKSIFVATGAKPNIAYEFEHRGTFVREGMEYKAYDDHDGKLEVIHPDGHVKTEQFGPFTSYQKNDYRVSFLGDTHPVFHGSVVKAIASGKRIYPKILKVLQHLSHPDSMQDPEHFSAEIKRQFSASVFDIKRHTETVVELIIHAPMAAKNFQPGHFYRVQNFETDAVLIGDTRLQSEAVALIGADVNKENGLISLMVLEQGVSSRLFSTFRRGQTLSVMGPTGVRTKIPQDKEMIMVVGGRMGAAYIRSVGPALRAAGNKILYIAGFREREEVYCQDELEKAADVILWITERGEPISPSRPDDRSVTGPYIEMLAKYANGEHHHGKPPIGINEIQRVLIVGTSRLIKMIQKARQAELSQYLRPEVQFTASIYGPMQCMLKGVCAQCLQWQIDPITGKRTKAVFACSWQDQPIDMVDLSNLDERLSQNRTQEILSNLWLDYLFDHYEVARV